MAYTQKNNPFKKSPCKSCGPSPLLQPEENIDWENLNPEQKKAMNLLPEVPITRYGVDVTRYKNIFENPETTMQPGHIQASIANPRSEVVRSDLGIEPGDPTQINPWYYGNPEVSSTTKLEGKERYKETPEYETQRVYLKKDQAKQFLDIAKTIKPTKDRGKFKIDLPEALGGDRYIDMNFLVEGANKTLPFGTEGYDFIRNNCAKGVCEALGVNPDKARRKSKVKYVGGVGGMVLDTLINKVMTDGGITEPKKAWNIVMKKFGIE